MIGETVTLLRRVETGTDRYGNPTFDWPLPGEELRNCGVAPRATDEPEEIARTPVYQGLTVFAPVGTVVGPHDRLIVRGEVFEVVGEPGDWRSPFSGWRPGVVINVDRWEG